ncbi:unnamed protein product [Ilex paraguariensis]|uniref:glutamate synthase (ferredoxin) n=1 Tax=Ilex paraguariensis TaxID=185542 RepID=A0ABC8V583_9AQUA
MLVRSVPHIPQLLHSNGQPPKGSSLFAANRDFVFVDFVGLCCKSKRTRRRIGDLNGRSFHRLATKNWSAIRAVLDLERVSNASEQVSDLKRKVAHLDDILSERGACGVGFIANLENKASHEIIKDAVTALGCMEHRGGCGADNDSGDGSGLMTSIPWDLFNDWAGKQGIGSIDKLHTGVGMVFLPKDDDLVNKAKTVIINIFKQEGLEVLGWRPVPVDASVVGYYARETMPNIQQVFVRVVKEENIDDIERELYVCRKLIERAVKSEAWASELYFCSLSNRTIVYKGMLRSEILARFYSDLQSNLYRSPFAIYHRRYSTNTSPRWPLAQPMRLLGHNGEINTIQGNLNWMQSRETSLKSPVWHGRENEICPYGNPKASDSANLDSAAELLLRSGRTPEEALMILVPEAYKKHPTLSIKYPEVVDFYDYYKGQMEAWDGPALLLFSDGKTVGACLDRNGLRPARYWRTRDNVVYVASEVGVLPVDDSKITMKGRLGPGMMISVDLQSGQVYENMEVKKRVALSNPYGKWVNENMRSFKPVNFLSTTVMDSEAILRCQQAYGYSSEDVQMVIETMAAQGKEPTFCMGDDIPLAVLSQKAHMLYDYFKQRFAQALELSDKNGHSEVMSQTGTNLSMNLASAVFFFRPAHVGHQRDLYDGKRLQLACYMESCLQPRGKYVQHHHTRIIIILLVSHLYTLESEVILVEAEQLKSLLIEQYMWCGLPVETVLHIVSFIMEVVDHGCLGKRNMMHEVTNPAIDPLREGLVMSLEVNLGKRGNILEVGPENASQVILPSPVLNEGELETLLKDPHLKPQVLSTFFDIRKGVDGSLEKTLYKLCQAADEAVRNGSQLLVLSDRSDELEPTRPAIPILLAVGAVHQHLIQNGLRMSASIVADTAQCFSTHQFACLIGYGASAVCPYLALETCRHWRLSNKTVNMMRNGKMPTVTIEQAQKNFCKGGEKGNGRPFCI